MKRSTFAFSAAAAALLLSRIAGAQLAVGNENDHLLENGGDVIYIYTDPSTGPGVGTSGVPDFATNDFLWRVTSKKAMKSCTGTAEMTGLDIFAFDFDFTFADAGGNNTAVADMYLSKSDTTNPPVNPLQIEPDQTDPNAVLVTFGPGTPKNNVFVTDPGCPPPNYLYGYEFDVDLTGGAGVGAGIVITADGNTDNCITDFIPGLQTYSGAGACGSGDGADPDLHSSDVLGGPGETQFDLVGGAQYSEFGGFGQSGVLGGTDGIREIAVNYGQFAEPIVNMRVDSATGVGLEEGLAGVEYLWPVSGGQLGADYFALQGIGKKCAIMGTLSPPLASCINFKGGKLGLLPTDPLFGIFLNLWTGTITQQDNGAASTGTVFDDGQFQTLVLPLGAHPGGTGAITLSFQGFYKKASGSVEGSPVTRTTLHW